MRRAGNDAIAGLASKPREDWGGGDPYLSSVAGGVGAGDTGGSRVGSAATLAEVARPARGSGATSALTLGWLALAWRRLHFPSSRRAETWQLLADVLAGGGQDIGRLLDAVADGYEAQGRRQVALALRDIREGLRQGRLRERVRAYAGTAEQILFDGVDRQDPAIVFAAAARMLRMQESLRRAVRGAVALPVLLVCGLLGLMAFFGRTLLPALEDLVSFETLPPVQRVVVGVTQSFADNPLALALWVGAAITGLALAQRHWTGRGRIFADRFPPFSLARLEAGASFLVAVVERDRTGSAVSSDYLERLALASPPYARSRILGIAREFTRAGNNLGEAALRAGHGFPVLELTAVLRTLWNTPGGIPRIGDVVERWLSRVEDTVRARMAALNAALLALVAAALVLLMSIGLPITDQISLGAGL